jgi:hypothetical protein
VQQIAALVDEFLRELFDGDRVVAKHLALEQRPGRRRHWSLDVQRRLSQAGDERKKENRVPHRSV